MNIRTKTTYNRPRKIITNNNGKSWKMSIKTPIFHKAGKKNPREY